MLSQPNSDRYDLEAIRAALPMLTVCEREGMEFKKQGGNWIGPCWTCTTRKGFTIHGNTPQHAHCYSCGWNGDVFAFWQERRGVTAFGQAVAELAGLCGIGPAQSGVQFKREPVKHKPATLADSGKPRLPEMRPLNEREKRELAALRGVSLAGIEAASEDGRLWFCFYPVDKATGRETANSWDSWCVTDAERWVAQWRRLDGELYFGAPDGVKSLSTRNTTWPIGAAEIGDRPNVILTEGGADMLAAYQFVAQLGLHATHAVVCILGGAMSIAPEALPHFRGKRVRIFADNDPPKEKQLTSGPVIVRTGWEAAAKWQDQLEQAGAAVDVVDWSSVPLPDIKDLNDFAKADHGTLDVEALFQFGEPEADAMNRARVYVGRLKPFLRGKEPEWETTKPASLEEPAPSTPRPAQQTEAPPSSGTIVALLAAAEEREIEELRNRLISGPPLKPAERKRLQAAEAKKERERREPRSEGTGFSAAATAERLKAWWVNGDGGNFYVDEDGDWLRIQKENLMLRLSEIGVPDVPMGGPELISPQAQTVLHIERRRKLDRAIEGLAGYSKGVHIINNRKTLMQRGAQLIVPEAGDWSVIDAMLSSRLGYDAAESTNPLQQVWYFEGWLQRALENLYLAGDVVLNGQVLALAGEQGSGKSRLQHFIITPALGGRSADPQPYLFGDTDFNDEWMEAEHLCTEDPRPSAKLHDRVQFAQKLKGLVVNDNHRWRGLYRGALTVTPKFRVSQSFNIDPDAVRFFPPLTPDFRDKVILLKVHNRPLPMPTGTPAERRAFREKIQEQLPAYIHYLLHELKLDPSLKNERFGVKEFADLEVRSMLWDDSPAAEFLELIDETELTIEREAGHANRRSIFHTPCGYTAEAAVAEYEFKQAGTPARQLVEIARRENRRLWIGRYAQLQDILEHPTSNRQRVAGKLIHHNSVARMLGRLSQDQPHRVAMHRTPSERLWVILSPKPEEDEQEAVVASL